MNVAEAPLASEPRLIVTVPSEATASPGSRSRTGRSPRPGQGVGDDDARGLRRALVRDLEGVRLGDAGLGVGFGLKVIRARSAWAVAVTAIDRANSEVLPDPSVAVAETTWPAGTDAASVEVTSALTGRVGHDDRGAEERLALPEAGRVGQRAGVELDGVGGIRRGVEVPSIVVPPAEP